MKELSDALLLAEETETYEVVLSKYFNHNSLYDYQRNIIDAVMDGRNALAVIPTGGGKSILYQLPAMLLPGKTLVVSPLIALMQDQVQTLQQNGIAAACLHSSLGKSERERVLRQIDSLKLLYSSPETLLGKNAPDLSDVSLIAVDEAHCISMWGHDFRPKYCQLLELKSRYPGAHVIALTASATREVRDDIICQLQLQDPYTYIGSFDRPNLQFQVIRKTQSNLKNLFRNLAGSTVVYVATRQEAEEVSHRLKNIFGKTSVPYYSTMKKADKLENQQKFMNTEVQILVATNAFGMGINKPDIRQVIHYTIPASIEAYHQETGRAGRDGLPAQCTLCYDPGDIERVQFIATNYITNEERMRVILKHIAYMKHYAEDTDDLRQFILDYFDGSLAKGSSATELMRRP